jgi:hypothetical protein
MKIKMSTFDKATWVVLAAAVLYCAWQILRVIL